MRKKVVWIGAGVLALAWLLPAALVVFHDPRVPVEVPALEASARAQGSSIFLLAHGYAKDWSVTTWEGEDEAAADKHTRSYVVVRGPLDRAAARFPLEVLCSSDHAQDLRGVRLYVSRSEDWIDGPDAAAWERVAEQAVAEPGRDEVALVCRADVHAASIAYRVELVFGNSAPEGFAQTMLTAPTFLGRVYDRVAWWPIFRWLPSVH